MKKGNNLKRIFAATAAFATLATTGVTATVHADSSNVPGSGTPGFVNGDSKQWAIDHGYLNPDGTSTVYNQPQPASKKTTIDAKSKKLGYVSRKIGTYNGKDTIQIFQNGKTPAEIGTIYAINTNNAEWPNDVYTRGGATTYFSGFRGGVNPDGSFGLMSTADQMPKIDYTKNRTLFSLFFLSGFFLSRNVVDNKNNPTNQDSPYYKGYVNAEVLYHKWLHFSVNKAFSFDKKTNNPKHYNETHKEPRIMDKGYSSKWLYNKIVWIVRNPDAALKEMRKYYNQSVLKDQRTNSAHNDFNNTTLK